MSQGSQFTVTCFPTGPFAPDEPGVTSRRHRWRSARGPRGSEAGVYYVYVLCRSPLIRMGGGSFFQGEQANGPAWALALARGRAGWGCGAGDGGDDSMVIAPAQES